MAVAIEMNFPGATLAQYDEVLKLMGLDDGSLPPGAIFPLGRVHRQRHPRRRRVGEPRAVRRLRA